VGETVAGRRLMLTKIRKHLTYANVMSTLCFFLLLGGTSIAAVSLKRNSVKGKHIAKNAVTAPKVKNASLLSEDFAPGQLPKGDKGDTGAPATALWAMVNSDGTLKRGRGVVSVGGGPSTYEVTFDRSVENCTYLSTLTEADNNANSFSSPPEGQSNAALSSLDKVARGLPGAESTVTVETTNSAGSGAAFDFNLAVFC
jgi:hypothetical protein